VPNVKPLADGDPRRLGAYDVSGRLGEGGQGLVYLGHGAAGPVAIKLLHTRLIEDEAARARFVREVEVTKRVARFCTAQVLDAGMADDRPYIVSEYVPGPSLHQQLREEGPRRGSALDRLAINTATALAAIHQAGVVHRDFKPGNVLMGPDGPVVIDFGIARALDASTTGTIAISQVVGTPAFMAPEQLADGPIGPHTDMFAWAATLAYAASGTPPFGYKPIPKVINQVLHEEPDLGVLEGRLRDIVAACLAKDPGRRPTARRLMDELMGHTGPHGDGDPAGPVPAPSSTGPHGHLPPGAAHAAAGSPGVADPDGMPEAGTMRLPGCAMAHGGATTRMPTPGQGTAYAAGAHTPGGGTPHVMGSHTPGGDTPYAMGAHTPGGGTPYAMGPHTPGGGTPYPPGSGYPPFAGPHDGVPTANRRRAGLLVAGAIVAAVVLVLGLGALVAARGHGGDGNAAAGPTPSRQVPHQVIHRTPSATPVHTPSHRPTPRVRTDPYTPQRVCGAGYRIIGAHGLGQARAFLLYNPRTGANCVVTMVARSTGKTLLVASLAVRNGGHESRSGSFLFFAGPVRLPAKGKCVMWGGASATARWTSGWTHCH
jgi:predicted Ser/Thr protein kinase